MRLKPLLSQKIQNEKEGSRDKVYSTAVMHINAQILHSILMESYEIRRYGRGIGELPLSLPLFYQRGQRPQKGKVYIAHTHDLPSSPSEESLFICIGSGPTNIWSSWRGEVFYIADGGTDITSVFNSVQDFFDLIVDWECRMQLLLEGGADVEEMLRISIPVFGNRITVIDYELRVIANCRAVDMSGRREVRIYKELDRVPDDKSVLFENIHQQSIKNREPFIYTEEGIDQYCINLYVGERYMGTCSLMEDFRPIRESDYALFQRFTGFIRRAMAMQSRALASQFVSLKAIFSELLQSLPVSQSDLHRALSLFHRSEPGQGARNTHWLGIVVRSANRGKTLPEGYLCTALEEMLPGCTAVAFEGVLVAFCAFDSKVIGVDDFCDILKPYLQDMNFLAGVSLPFSDIYKARSYFHQAGCALETGYDSALNSLIFKFEDCALTYMLRHACGQFEPELIIPPGLKALREYGGGVDYWDTLRQYLDNESNASQTAKDLFLHRSSLLPRLEKIKIFVDMDTPEQRLYLRMCIHLYDMLEAKEEIKS